MIQPESAGPTHKGSWSGWYRCPEGSWVKQFEIRYEKNQGSGDDTGLNGLYLSCYSGDEKVTEVGTSGPWGNESGSSKFCHHGYATAAQLKAESNTADDTSINSVDMLCKSPKNTSGSGSWMTPSKSSPWGSWLKAKHCPSGYAINGFDIKIDSNNGANDDAGATKIDFSCKKGKTLFLEPLKLNFFTFKFSYNNFRQSHFIY